MSRVVDYAWGHPSTAALHAAGAVAVCRYLCYPSSKTDGKRLTRGEADTLRAAGVDVVSNWEQSGSWAEYSGGHTTGAAHATAAAGQHLACGGPADRPIYFSTDFPPTPAQLPAVADYFRGVASVIGLARTGAYGGYDTIKHLFDLGVIRWGWQTYAWSGGRWDPRAQLRQVSNGVKVGGTDCDLNDSTTADFGQWGISKGTSMEQTDGLIGFKGRGSVGDELADDHNLRDWWYDPADGSAGFCRNPPPANSRLVHLLAAADKVLAGQPLALTDADRTAIAQEVAALILPALSASGAVVTDAVKAALREGTG